MQIQTLYNRRRNDRAAADIVRKLNCVFNGFLATNALRSAFERKIDRHLFEKAQNGWSPVDRHTRQLTNTNTRARQRGHLSAREEVETVFVVILVDENLRSLFRRNCLLDIVREDLPEREV